mgnify:CR=1 FL=1
MSSRGSDLKSEVVSLGQSEYFIVFEGSPENYRAVENPIKWAGAEAGVEAAREIRKLDVDILVTGSIGPRTYDLLRDSGISIKAGCSGTVADSIRKCVAGELPECKGATFAGYIGI